MTPEFLLTTFIIVASPGTGVLYTIATGLSGGARVSMIAALGCTLGIVPHMLTVITGLAVLLHTNEIVFKIIKYLGAIYLLYMAWKTINEKRKLNINSEVRTQSYRQVITSAILINLLNPKLSIFFLAFLPQFVIKSDISPVTQMLEMSLIFMAITFFVFMQYGISAARVREYVVANESVQRWVLRFFSVSFFILAVKLALMEV
ncbi:Homoserine/homoserine lactone efflux protein [Serratia liquefaciens]|uniref:LysE family translocator n=1 Tax=Serratia liquefaciens TaxID=614 RepID=UPI00217B69F7|nr:LysE family translocator [Serratia liquefaciens]CAI1019838.1 Homoserine/homoserine lactone efflux protein [Serratia liquefaciens]